MKNDILLTRLYKAQKNEIELSELIETIKEEIKTESLPDCTPKKQYKATLKFLNQKHLKSRPVLKLTHLEKNYQVFSDSYMLFRFYNDSIIDQLPKTTDPGNENFNYPRTEGLCRVFEKGLESEEFSVLDLKQIIKTVEKNGLKEKPFDIKLSKETSVYIDGVKLENAFDIMNMKNSDIFTFLYYPVSGYTFSPIGIKRKDKEVLILPMRRV